MTTSIATREHTLRAALVGVELTADDARLLSWLATWDQSTTDRLAGLIVRARASLSPVEVAPDLDAGPLVCPPCALSAVSRALGALERHTTRTTTATSEPRR